MSETELDSVATGATEPEAETGEADDVSDYSEEPAEPDPAGEAEDVVSSADGALDESAVDAEEEGTRRRKRTPRRTRPTARGRSSSASFACSPGTGMWCTRTRVTRTG